MASTSLKPIINGSTEPISKKRTREDTNTDETPNKKPTGSKDFSASFRGEWITKCPSSDEDILKKTRAFYDKRGIHKDFDLEAFLDSKIPIRTKYFLALLGFEFDYTLWDIYTALENKNTEKAKQMLQDFIEADNSTTGLELGPINRWLLSKSICLWVLDLINTIHKESKWESSQLFSYFSLITVAVEGINEKQSYECLLYLRNLIHRPTLKKMCLNATKSNKELTEKNLKIIGL